MKTEKTNMDYLKEFIKDNDEAIEFYDAVKNEIDEKDDYIQGLRDEVSDLENELDEIETERKESIPVDDLQIIDCGIGDIKFVMPDNLKLSMIMESLQDNPKKLFEL